MSAGYHLEDDLEQRSYDRHLMRRLLAYVRPYRGWMITAVLLLLVVALLSNITPVLIMRLLDHYINNPDRMALQQDGAPNVGAQLDTLIQQDTRGLMVIIGFFALLLVLESVLRYVQLLIVSFIGQKTMLEMRVSLFEHLQRMSLRFLDKHPVGRLMTRVTNDVEKVQQTIVSGVVQVASDLMTLVVVLIVMFAINWQLALVTLAPVPFIFATSLIFRKYAQRSFLEIRRRIAHVNAHFQENISGMRIVQIFGRQDSSHEEYRGRNAEHRDEWFRQIRNFAVYFPVIEFLSTLATSLIVLYCGVMILQLGREESGLASIGVMVAFVVLADRFYGPIRAVADRYNLLLEAMASSERIFQLLDTPEDIVDPPLPHRPAEVAGHVVFRDVRFSYDHRDSDDPTWVIKGLSFDIDPGERVAIVGHTGAGKSTIVNLLSRFYDVQEGAIEVDGIDVRDYDQVALRRRIGIVLQDVFLFSGTIAENIRLGDPEMAMDRVQACAEYVNAARFIDRLPGRYDYHVGERGCNLSTGQRQLLAFARTLAHDPQILVLDEATSSIDTETEGLIQDAIAKLMAGRTSIVIAHRLSTVQHADRILVMHHGELRERGTHHELLRQDGLYRMLYELQYKEQGG